MNEPISIRRGVIADIESVRACVADAYRPYVRLLGKEPAAMRTDFAPYIAREQVLVATLARRLVGVVIALDLDDCIEIRSMAVAPDFQRRGIGSLLLARAQQQAQALGRKTLRLYTNAQLPELVLMYGRMGFVEQERKQDGGYDRVFMTKEV